MGRYSERQRSTAILMPLFAIQAAEYVQFGRHDATATYE
jgi:hypothetical protein